MKEKTKKNGVLPTDVNFLVQNTSIKGDITTENDIRIDGKIEGNITSKGKLVLGETGEITGDIKSKSADISGKIKGKIFIEDIIILSETAVIEGEITTSKITIEPGAIFNGVCKMSAGGHQEKK